MTIVYGHDGEPFQREDSLMVTLMLDQVVSKDDYYVQLVEEAIMSGSEATPGRYLVDTFPWRESIVSSFRRLPLPMSSSAIRKFKSNTYQNGFPAQDRFKKTDGRERSSRMPCGMICFASRRLEWYVCAEPEAEGDGDVSDLIFAPLAGGQCASMYHNAAPRGTPR